MVENRDEHREPVIRAFVALPVETLVEVVERRLPGSGLCVPATWVYKSRRTNMYKRKPVVKLTGSERFTNTNGKEFSVLDFWQYGFSNLNSNVLRGALAEFLVENALKESEDIAVRNPWGDYDVVTESGTTVEVKCSSYLQDWDQNNLSRIVWSGLKAKTLYWSSAVNEEKKDEKPEYKSDIYVLAFVHHTDSETLNLLDMDQWSFYVLLRDDVRKITGDGGSISLSVLQKHNVRTLTFAELGRAILAQQSEFQKRA